MGKTVNLSTKLNKKEGFFLRSVYRMKKNSDICTAKFDFTDYKGINNRK